MQVLLFWKANLHNKAVIKILFFCLVCFLQALIDLLFFRAGTTFMRERQSSVVFRGRHGIAIMYCTVISAHISSFNLLFLSEHSWRVAKDPDENMHSQPSCQISPPYSRCAFFPLSWKKKNVRGNAFFALIVPCQQLSSPTTTSKNLSVPACTVSRTMTSY